MAADDARADAVAVKALARAFSAWRLGGSGAAELAGVSLRTWHRMKNGTWAGTLSRDQRLRASALIGLYKGLHLYFGDALADKWPKMANNGPLFGGRSPVEVMAEGGLPAILEARRYVDAARGGM
ncbi:DUF2384 domain-containing protein [Sphingomonas parva]|uniref:DUF2384 domain-containing protein n=1 Tax=Sphingomonas parva TaxID=2555898 RepID=A0A4Y8ZT63_9SPHN|nr:DUF2384 domain-containing protein [Sphingomonas parva]